MRDATHPTEKPARSPLMELIVIAGPTVATMTSYTVMTFTDKWIVSRMGPEYLGAQGNGGIAAWVPQSICMGLVGVINTYVSQNMGAGKPERGAAYAWNGLWLSAAWWLLLVPYIFFLPQLFRWAGIDPVQAQLAVIYGQILLWGCFLNMFTRALSQFFFGMHRASVVLVAGVVANVANLIISCMLVFGAGPVPAELGIVGRASAWAAGLLNIPALGIAGSAWGTVAATVVELAILLGVFLSPKLNKLYSTRRPWRLSIPHIKDIIRIGWPGGLMFGNEMVCWAFFMVYLVSHFGAEHASAGYIAHQYMSLSFMPTVGISVAVTAIVGKYIGMGKPDIAARRAWLGVWVAGIYMTLCALAFVVFREPLVRLFIEKDVSPEDADTLVRLGSHMLIAAAAFQLFDAVAMVMSGALRGAGDTIFPGIATVIASWVIIVLGGLGMIHWFPQLQSIGPWIAAAAYIFALCVMLLLRFTSGHWKKIRLLKPDAEPMAAAGGTTDGII